MSDFNANHWIATIDRIEKSLPQNATSRELERTMARLNGIMASILIGPYKYHDDVELVVHAKNAAIFKVNNLLEEAYEKEYGVKHE